MIVSTPQNVALSDVRKGIAMLRKVSVPVRLYRFHRGMHVRLIHPNSDHRICSQSILLFMPDVFIPKSTLSIRYVISGRLVVKAYIYVFLGEPDNFRRIAEQLDVPVLGELPLVQGVSSSADGGRPFVLSSQGSVLETDGVGGVVWKESMKQIANSVFSKLQTSS